MSSLSLAQRRHLDPQHVQPIEQSPRGTARCARALRGSRLVAAITRTSTWMSPDAADAPKRLLFEHAQQLRLQRRRHLADFVEEHGALVGLLEQAALLLARVGERAALVAEQLRFEQRLGQRRARDVQERPRRAAAQVMNDLGDQVLARAALARDQHGRRRARRDLAHELLHALHRLGFADDRRDAERPRERIAQRPQFAAQPRRLERARHAQRDVVEVERLRRVVERAGLHRLDDRLDAACGRSA